VKHLYSLCIFFGLYFIGELIVRLTDIFIPAGIIGMILLFILLCLKVVKLEMIQETGKFLLDNMIVFMIPAAVGFLTVWHLVADKIVPYLILNVAATLIIFAVTGHTAQALVRAREKKDNKDAEKTEVQDNDVK